MFVLVFQNTTNEAEEIRWIAPQEMSDRITELIEAANSPEGQAGRNTPFALATHRLTEV